MAKHEKSEHPINVSANQNTAFDKKVFQNNNTSAQSHLGEHGPLKHDLLCLSLKWTHSKKKNSKSKHAYRSKKSKKLSKIFHFQLKLLSSNFEVRTTINRAEQTIKLTYQIPK